MSSSSPPTIEKRFVDYFVVCGLDLKSGLEPDQLSGDNLQLTPLDRPYRSKTLAHYPENVPWNQFDANGVNMLCLPQGLSFRTQKHIIKDTFFHSFILTREDGSRVYGSAFTYYEEVTDKQICTAMQTLQAMHLTELSSSKAHLHRPTHADSGVSRSLPRSFKLSTKQPNTTSNGSLYDVTKDTLHVSKCICLITQQPFVNACRTILQSLYRLVQSPESLPLPMESYIYNILYEIPLPPPGRSLKLCYLYQDFLCQRPGSGELPLFDYSFRELFVTLGVENVILLFTSVMFETQILMCCEDYQKLMLVAECIICLLFPFTWHHVYVPILPTSLHHFLEAPLPFIMGLKVGKDDTSQLSVPGEANLCFVDIDGHTVEVPEDLPVFPYKNELISELYDTLSKYGIYLSNGLLDRNSNERNSRHRRKHSWSFESGDSGVSSSDSSARSSYSSLASTQGQLLQQSEAFQRITAVARRTGVMNSLEDLRKPRRYDNEGNTTSHPRTPTENQKYLDDLKINNAVREIFLNRFIHMFSSYDHFVIQPDQKDMEQWLASRDTVHNFDKTTFLSDQPEPHLPFLSRFIETQMFSTLIDNKILSQWEDPDPYLKIFDSRIALLRDHLGDPVIRAPCYEPCTTIKETEVSIENRMAIADLTAPIPKIIDPTIDLPSRRNHKPGSFPSLDNAVLNREPARSKLKKRTSAQWKRKDKLQQHAEHIQLTSEQKESDQKHAAKLWQKYISEARLKNMKHPKFSDTSSPAAIAQTNWKFVEALLTECKNRTKRMLVEKMGQEAVELGHSDISITGLEENTLLASLCDLLERIWNHGLQTKQGKSALWSHLLRYLEIEECKATGKPIDRNFLTPDISSLSPESETPSRGRETKERSRRARTPDLPCLKPPMVSLTTDIKFVQSITEIKTEIGYARAWVRLALEKKLLSRHLKKLLSGQELLRSLYKRYAFLRCDDEKEQFLYYLLTLNAVDYYCFTNTYTATVMPYRVVVFPSRKLNASTTSANPWIIVSGTLGATGMINLSRQTLEIVFHHKNLGQLTTLRIGHDNSGISPRWMIEHVLVRNDVTGHTYKFPCGRWLGKGVDDGSTERLLVAELVPPDVDNEELMETCRTPPRCRSPSVPRRPSEPKLTVPEIQQLLGDAVNNIVKYYYKPERERGSLTILLCGELGLVYCLEQVFLYGFKATRFFRHVYLWDFFVKVKQFFETVLQEEEALAQNSRSRSHHEHVAVMDMYCKLVDRIDRASHTVGKDGKFQLFICFAARDHLLHRMLLHVASAPVTASMYEEQSFLRDSNLVTFLVQIIESLSEFNLVLETSLTKGIET